MSKTYEIYIQLLIQQQHSPMIQTIAKYDPNGFSDNNPLSIAEKVRVLRYRSEKIILDELLLTQFIDTFRQERKIFIIFLRRLTSPILEAELIDQFKIEKIILQIELDSTIIEQFNQWSEKCCLTSQFLQQLLLCENMAQFITLLTQYQAEQLKVINHLDISVNPIISEESKQGEITKTSFEIYQNYYQPKSKKKIVHFTRSSELNNFEQNKIINLISKKKPQNIKDVFSLIMLQFDLQPLFQYLEKNQEWFCEIEVKSITTKQRAPNKGQAQLLSQMHLMKLIAPNVFDFILSNTNSTFQTIVEEKGKISIIGQLPNKIKIMPNEEYLQQLPYCFSKIEVYIQNMHNTQTCAIRKFQNEVTNYLIQKFNQFSINKQIESVASTYELSIEYTQNNKVCKDHQIFATKLRFCYARLIAQQYLINVIGALIFGEEIPLQFNNMLQFLQKIS